MKSKFSKIIVCEPIGGYKIKCYVVGDKLLSKTYERNNFLSLLEKEVEEMADKYFRWRFPFSDKWGLKYYSYDNNKFYFVFILEEKEK